VAAPRRSVIGFVSCLFARGDSARPGGLHARLYHAFLVSSGPMRQLVSFWRQAFSHRIVTKTRNPKVIWEEPRRRPSRRESHWLQWDAQSLPLKLPLSLRRSPPLSITSIPRRPDSPPKRYPDLINRFGAVHPLDRPTDRQMDWRQVCTNTRLRSIDCIAMRLTTESSDKTRDSTAYKRFREWWITIRCYKKSI